MSDDAGAQGSMSDEERARAAREQFKRLRVLDVAYEMMVGLVTVGYQKLGLTDQTRELRDLGDARLAIELLRAVLEVAEKEPGGAQLKDMRSTLAQMQLGYAHAVQLDVPQPATSSASSSQASEEPAAGGGEPTSEAPAGNDVKTEKSDARGAVAEDPSEDSDAAEGASRAAAPAKGDQEKAAPKAPARKRAAPKTASGKKAAPKKAAPKKAGPEEAAPKKAAPRRPRGGATPAAD
jgi:hypothetical protein